MLTSSPKVRLIGEHAHTKISRARGALLNAALIQELLGIPSYSHRVRSSDGSVMSVRAQEDGAHDIEIVVNKQNQLTTTATRVCFYIDGVSFGPGEYEARSVRIYIAKVYKNVRGHSPEKNALNPNEGTWKIIGHFISSEHDQNFPMPLPKWKARIAYPVRDDWGAVDSREYHDISDRHALSGIDEAVEARRKEAKHSTSPTSYRVLPAGGGCGVYSSTELELASVVRWAYGAHPIWLFGATSTSVFPVNTAVNFTGVVALSSIQGAVNTGRLNPSKYEGACVVCEWEFKRKILVALRYPGSVVIMCDDDILFQIPDVAEREFADMAGSVVPTRDGERVYIHLDVGDSSRTDAGLLNRYWCKQNPVDLHFEVGRLVVVSFFIDANTGKAAAGSANALGRDSKFKLGIRPNGTYFSTPRLNNPCGDIPLWDENKYDISKLFKIAGQIIDVGMRDECPAPVDLLSPYLRITQTGIDAFMVGYSASEQGENLTIYTLDRYAHVQPASCFVPHPAPPADQRTYCLYRKATMKVVSKYKVGGTYSLLGYEVYFNINYSPSFVLYEETYVSSGDCSNSGSVLEISSTENGEILDGDPVSTGCDEYSVTHVLNRLTHDGEPIEHKETAHCIAVPFRTDSFLGIEYIAKSGKYQDEGYAETIVVASGKTILVDGRKGSDVKFEAMTMPAMARPGDRVAASIPHPRYMSDLGHVGYRYEGGEAVAIYCANHYPAGGFNFVTGAHYNKHLHGADVWITDTHTNDIISVRALLDQYFELPSPAFPLAQQIYFTGSTHHWHASVRVVPIPDTMLHSDFIPAPQI